LDRALAGRSLAASGWAVLSHQQPQRVQAEALEVGLGALFV